MTEWTWETTAKTANLVADINRLKADNERLHRELRTATKRASEAEDGKVRLSMSCDAAIQGARESAAGDAIRENRELRAALQETARKLNARISQVDDLMALKMAWREFREAEKGVRRASEKLDLLTFREDT